MRRKERQRMMKDEDKNLCIEKKKIERKDSRNEKGMTVEFFFYANAM